jgi:hypothetical protein
MPHFQIITRRAPALDVGPCRPARARGTLSPLSPANDIQPEIRIAAIAPAGAEPSDQEIC